MAQSKMALITFFESGEPVDPGYGQPGYGGGRPDNSLPRPPGSIGTLPVFPFDPSGHPDNTLPGSGGEVTPPIQLHPGLRLVVKWVACYGFVGVPDNTLPEHAQPK